MESTRPDDDPDAAAIDGSPAERGVTSESAPEHVRDETPDPAPEQGSHAVADVLSEIERREFAYEILAPAAVRVTIPAGDVVMGAVPVLDAATSAVAVLAESRDGASAVVMRDGEDMFVVKRSPGSWEHFRSRGGPSAIYGSWRTGERTRFRMRHGALWQAIPAAVSLAESLGVAHLLPAETPPPPPRPAPEPQKRRSTTRARTDASRSTRPASRSTSSSASAPRGATRTSTRGQEEPPPRICMRCFVQLPTSGICDCA